MGYFDTAHWKFEILADFKKRTDVEFTKEEECHKCNGRGFVGGGFKSIDGPAECYYCSGRGVLTIRVIECEPKPEIDPELTNHMRKAFKEFVESRKSIVE